MRVALIAVFCLSLVSSAVAQSHPCDTSWLTMQTVTPGVAYRMQICAEGSPTDGVLIVDGTARPREALALARGPNAAGLSLFDGTVNVTLTAGAHALQAAVYVNGVESSRTPVLTVQAGALPAPAPAPTPVPAPAPAPPTPASACTEVSGGTDALGHVWALSSGWTLRDGAYSMPGGAALPGAAGTKYVFPGGVTHVYDARFASWRKWDEVTKWKSVGASVPACAAAPVPTPTPAPVPPVDVCVSSPLVVSGVKWPTSNTGTRTVTFGVGTRKWLKETLEWRADGKHVLTVMDDRGCTAVVKKP
jgi:hypothetical protein